MTITSGYGTWASPISAGDLAAGHPVTGARFVGDELWWSELRPNEGGRYAVCRAAAVGAPVDVLSPPWNARSRVHEYGGGAWTATMDGRLVFAEFSDQRLYRLDRGGQPVPLTPEPATAAGLRYGDLTVVESMNEVWCVRERHGPAGRPVRDIVAVPLDGAAADDPSQARSVVGGSDFLAYPRRSPSGRQLAWIAWDHPQMAWDGTQLCVADLGSDGTCGPWRAVLGSSTESVLQPEWADEEHLFVVSDRSGWWNLYRVAAIGSATPQPLWPVDADIGAPLWELGGCSYAVLPDGRLLTVRTVGRDQLALLDPLSGTPVDVDLGNVTSLGLASVRSTSVALVSGGDRSPHGLRLLDLASGSVDLVRSSFDAFPAAGYMPTAAATTFTGPGGREVHAFVYAPANRDYSAPDGELPPYVAFVHGGPTAHVSARSDLAIAYLTSRGIGVVDVNYGGSSGYGRAYRDRLRGQWGVVDVHDTLAAVLGLVDAGLADRSRLAIAGGSAGGWTVLSALTTTDVFACGTSYYGITDPATFAADTHDFESRYLDGLIGPLPQARELYERRSPAHNVAGVSGPVLLLQGLDDAVVPPSQFQLFRDGLLANGLPHSYVTFAGESHGFRRAATVVRAREEELCFFGQVMGFEPRGVSRR